MKGVQSESLRDRLKRFSRKSDNGCIDWIGHIEKGGYAHVRYKGVRTYAHRASWTIANGVIPKGKLVLHKCDNKKCINPDHLFIGTQRDNMRDMIKKGRKVVAKGNRHGMAKLSEEAARFIIHSAKEGCSQAYLARTFSLSKQAISSIVTGRSWAHLER